jgi:integrase
LSFYKNHLIPAFEDIPLSKINRFACQQWLNSKAGLSKSLILKCNVHLRAVLEEAVAQRYLDRNPAARLEIPRYAKSNERHLSLAEAQRLLGALVSPRERLVLRIHLLCGLRPGETFALRWNDVRGRLLAIDETVNLGQRKQGAETVTTKTIASTAPVTLPKSLAAEIEQWRTIRQPATEDEFLFPSVQAGKPMSYNTYLKKVLQPIAAGVGVPDLTFQSLRRTFATLAQKHGLPKDLQTQIRHADPAMTLRVYAKQIPESVAAMVEALDEELGMGEKPSEA